MNAKQEHSPVTPLDLHARSGRARDRRGSALLIVIGTLALVAVFAAVYVAIGRTDRRSANALRARKDQTETKINVAEYLGGVIGSDRLDAYVQYDHTGTTFARRELIDVPYTDWTRRSEANPGSEQALLFTATGRPYEVGNLNPSNDFRVQNDPWLASTLPTYLGTPGDGGPAGTRSLRPFSSYEGYNPNFPNSKDFLDNRDWLQISNFAPDGRPVNLFNLRPNSADFGSFGAEVGGFDSEPGFGTSPRADGRPIRRMSNFLSLLRPEGDPNNPDPKARIMAFDPAIDGVWVPGYNAPQNIGITGTDLYNIPAVWTMYQRFMYLPLNQPFITLNRQSEVSTWADPDYPAYQYADADGDGFADSRWFELVAARDLMGEVSMGMDPSPRPDIQWLYDKGDTRFFIAARAVDLSSMVNVNTATDQLVAPTIEYPMGLTPADVDLRRLLTMQDPASNYTSVPSNNPSATATVPLSYQALHRPYTTSQEYIVPRTWDGPPRPVVEFGRDVYDYNFYQHTATSIGSASSLLNLDSDAPSMLIGRYAYDALRRGITQGNSLTGDYKGYNLQQGGTATRRTDLLQYEASPGDNSSVPVQITAEERVVQYMDTGRLDPTNVGLAWSRSGSGGTRYGSGLYGLEDLAELLTFHGLNDPEVTSRLERVTAGRYESPMSDALQTRRLDPLISNRPLTLDREQHGQVLAANDLRIPPYPDNLSDVTGEVSANSMAHMALTPRNKLTTVSGFNPIFPGEKLAEADEPAAMTSLSIPPTIAQALSDAKAGFRVYAGALARELDADHMFWPSDPSMFQTDPTSTLFYGHRGAELALQVAAHAAVNMKDLADGDTETTVATLMLDKNLRDPMTDQANFNDPETDGLYQLYPGTADGNLLDPGVTQLSNSGGLPDERQAVNVYGMEAMPVITEVSSLYVFMDASDAGAAAGDDDFGPDPVVGSSSVTYPNASDRENITIDGTVSNGNKDYLLSLLAVQLHNPYDHPISLGGEGDSGELAADAPLTRHRRYDDENTIDVNSNYQFGYYIEFAGRFYKLGKYIEWYPTQENTENYYAQDSGDPAFMSVANPIDDYPEGSNGGVMNPGSFPDFITRNVVLGSGETRVFYVLADRRFDDPGGTNGPDDRWTAELNNWGRLPHNFTNPDPENDLDMDNLPDGPSDARGWTGPAEEWVNGQLSIRGSGQTPVLLMEFDPRNGELRNENPPALIDPNIDEPSPIVPGRTADNLEVRLWKKITTAQEEVDETDPDFDHPTYRNLVENDLLVDRFGLDGPLSVPLESGDDEIENTISYAEDFEDVDPSTGERIRNDNTGITIARWKTARRLDSDTEEEPSPGQVTPWMLRSRGNPALTRNSSASDLAIPDDIGSITAMKLFDGADVTDIEIPVTIKKDYEIQQSLRDMWDLSRDHHIIVKTLSLPPHSKSGLDEPGSAQNPVDPGDTENRTVLKFPEKLLSSVDPTGAANLEPGPDGKDLVPEIFVDGDNVSQSPRLADLLLAWGIGPSYAPDPSRGANTPEYKAEEWMTAPEAMALALGVDDSAPVSSFTDADTIWKNIYDKDAIPDDNLFDLGRLAIDKYVPYINSGTSETPPEFTLGTDMIRGDGVPLALGVIDRARAISPLDRLTDPLNPTGDDLLALGLSRPTFGTININTAPLEVLRLLPGLNPSRSQYSTTAGGLTDEWWGKGFMDAEMPDTISAGTDAYSQVHANPDLAAGIVAYRDRIYTTPSTASRPGPWEVGFYDNAPMNMSPTPTSLGLVARNMIGEIPLWNPPAALNMGLGNIAMDRTTLTGIAGLRETPGFGSLGELLALRLNPALEGDLRWDSLPALMMQYMGYDGRAQGVDNTSGDPVTALSQVFGDDGVDPTAGDTVDGYDEKLAAANAVFNMISVRSDFFAVWVVVQGFKESDVANLRPEDPLVPSFKKRYLMVVDRSNVIEPGDEPKVLLLKEVPL